MTYPYSFCGGGGVSPHLTLLVNAVNSGEGSLDGRVDMISTRHDVTVNAVNRHMCIHICTNVK